MSIHVIKYTPEQWYSYAEAAHRLIFGEQRDPWLDRISYALLAVRGEQTVGYVTIRETDAESVYWQHGGALVEYRSLAAVRAFQAFLAHARDRYKRCTTYVSNANVNYLHLLMKHDFRVIGVRYVRGEVYLELFQEFDSDAKEPRGHASRERLPEAPEKDEDTGRSQIREKESMASHG